MNLRKDIDTQLILIILVTTLGNVASNSHSHSHSGRTHSRHVADNNLGPGDPLYVTPLLESGQADSARRQAEVDRHLMLNMKSYAGFFTVNKTTNSNLFFWYFPAKVDSATAPVVLYLEGGPGVTTLLSLFEQNGPFSVAPGGRLVKRRESWTNKHNVIYMDNPVGTGYSFTDNEAALPTGQIQIGDELRMAMVQFFELFPSLRSNDFFVTGESYAGKYVPAASHSIHLYNENAEEEKKINLKGLAIANGYTDPVNQLVYGEYLYEIGLVDANGRDQFLALEKQSRDLILQHQHAAAYDVVAKLVEGPNTLFKNLTGYNAAFNILETEDPINIEAAFAWVQRPNIRRAIHVGNNAFVPFAEKVSNRLKNDATQSQANLVAMLLEHYRVLIYTGHLDIVCAYVNVQNYLRNLSWSGAEELKTAKRQEWRVESGELAGYIKKVKNLNEVLVRKAGHLSSIDQPQWTLELLEKFTHRTL